MVWFIVHYLSCYHGNQFFSISLFLNEEVFFFTVAFTVPLAHIKLK